MISYIIPKMQKLNYHITNIWNDLETSNSDVRKERQAKPCYAFDRKVLQKSDAHDHPLLIKVSERTQNIV